MDSLERSAFEFINQPRDDEEWLEALIESDIAQAVEDGFNGHKVRRDVILKDVNWLIEQAKRAEIYKKALLEIGSNKFMSEESGIANNALIKADIEFNC